MDIKNLFKQKKTSGAKYKKLPEGLSEEIANLKTCAEVYAFAKKILNPDEVLRTTGKTIKVFRKIERDSQVSACVKSRQAGVTSLKFRLNYGDDDRYKDFYEGVLKNLDVVKIIQTILNAPLYGYQPIEIYWTCDDNGNVVPEKLIGKPQEWFGYNTDGELIFYTKGNLDGIVISSESKKFLDVRDGDDYINPYGKSVLSNCFWDVIFKKGSKELWMKFAERFGMPTVIGKYPDGMSDDEINNLLSTLENLIQDAVGAIPDNNTIEFLDATSRGSSSEVYEKLIETADKSIAKNILGQTLTTDSGNSGSYALGNVHYMVRQDIIDSDARLCEKQFNILLSWIHELNFGEGASPVFEFYTDKDGDKITAERDKILCDTGIRFTKDYYKKTYGLSDEDFELSSVEKVNDFSEKPSKSNEFSSKINRDMELIDNFINNISESDIEKIIEPKLRQVIQTFSETRDLEEVSKALDELYPQESEKDITSMLGKAIFISDLLGMKKDDNE